MSNMRIFNVKGDGHCFYRCIWNIAKNNESIIRSLNLINIDNEEISVKEIRRYVSLLLNSKLRYINIINNLMKLFTDYSLIENYPILKFIDLKKDLEYNCNIISNIIDTTNIMASSIELEIIKDAFKELDIEIIVLCQNDTDNLSDKWCRELSKC